MYKKQVFLKNGQLKTQGPCRDCELKSIYFGLHTSYQFQDTDHFSLLENHVQYRISLTKKLNFKIKFQSILFVVRYFKQ